MGTDYAWKTANGDKIFAIGSGTTRPSGKAASPLEPLPPHEISDIGQLVHLTMPAIIRAGELRPRLTRTVPALPPRAISEISQLTMPAVVRDGEL